MATNSAVPATATPADLLGSVVDRLRRIPVAARRFAVSPARAQIVYRIDGELVSRLVSAGLPHVPAADGPLFDDHDLTNLSLRLRLRSPQRAAMRYWAGVLTRPSGEQRRYLIDYLGPCPLPGHPGACEFTCRTPDGEVLVRREAAEAEAALPLLSAPVTLYNDWPELPADLVDLVGELDGIEFYRLPDGVKADVDFMLAERIGDCLGIARYLVQHGTRRGLRMRCVFGLVVSPPFSTQHYWAEVDVGGRWVPVDPGLLRGLAAWGVIEPGWPASRSPGAFLAPLSDRDGIAVADRGVPTMVAFRTRLMTGSAG